ncbi:MAG: MFS transporter [Ignavibacteriales bacterium]|nr:MFS transporter [Ignavibacteriales bacterium]
MKTTKRNPWAWVPSLYFAEGIPYVIVMTVSVIMYKRLGLSNTEIALYTSWLYLPWVIKPFWSPLVDIVRTKRFWIVIMQLILGAGLGGVALTIPGDDYVKYTLAFFWLLAFSSATHDIAADGFYMLGLSQNEQTFFVGIRSTFYRFAMITGQGLLIMLAGYLEVSSGLPPVEIHVKSVISQSEMKPSLPEFAIDTVSADTLGLQSNSTSILVQASPLDKHTGDSLIAFVKNQNILNKFVEGTTSQPKVSGVGEKTGNIGIGYIKLSAKPDKDVHVITDHNSGDKSITLIEGSRFTFTAANWNKPAYFVVQLDKKLKSESSATFQSRAGDLKHAWSVTFFILTGMFLLFFLYHALVLPKPVTDVAIKQGDKSIFAEFLKTFAAFFKKEKIGVSIAFLLIYRFGEAQLIKLASPFLLDPRSVGGLELTTGQVGFVYGTVGILGLTIGGILGGVLASRQGLKHWLWWMFLAINIPHLLYIYLSFMQPENFIIINLCVAGEQFGYGFGFTAYMLYMIYISDGEYKTAHYAITTGFMALSMMIPGLFSGYLQELMGYKFFFIWILLTMIPGYWILKKIQINPEFGKKKIALAEAVEDNA